MEAIAKIINLTTRMQTYQASETDLRVCQHCGDTVEMIVEILGKKRIMPKNCGCRSEMLRLQRAADLNAEKQRRLERLRVYSMMDEQFTQCTFQQFVVDEYNKKSYTVGINYCEKWKKMKENSLGLLLYGQPGTGKSFLSFAIANQLMEQMVPVIAISSIGLLNKIKDTYNRYGKEGEAEIIHSLNNAALLVLDDLGAENSTEWAKEKLYEIIDSRNRSKKPLIVTTNLSREQLKEKLTSLDGVTRTYDRLVEMCVPIEVKGPSRRIQAGNEKYKILSQLMSGRERENE